MKRFIIYIIAIILTVFGFSSTSISSHYPWKAIFIKGGTTPAEFGFQKALELHIDLGRELSNEEIGHLQGKIKIVDKNREECRLCSYSFGNNASISIKDPKTGKKISWHADFAIFLKYLVQSQSSTYTLFWKDYPSLSIGNPFATPFIRIERKNREKLNLKSSVKSSAEVRLICEAQELLIYLGYSPGTVDGLVGPKTQKAVAEFQKDNNLPLDPLPDRSILQSLRASYHIARPHQLKSKVSFFPKRPANGQVLKASKDSDIAPLKILTPSKGLDFLVKLVDKGTKETIKIFYVRGGSSVKTRVPLGSFLLKYAAGEQWFGNNCLFGRKTVYSKADKTFKFYRSGNRVSGYTVELILQVGGNLPTSKIPPDEW